MSQRARRSFNAAQKADAVRLVQQVGNLSQVARDLDVNPNMLRKWVKQASIDAAKDSGGLLTTEERAELTRLRRETRTLQMERDFQKNRDLLRHGTGSACELIEAEKVSYPIALMCRVLEISLSALYAWRRLRTQRLVRERADGAIATQIHQIHKASLATYGSPRVHAKLRREGVRIGRKRVERVVEIRQPETRAVPKHRKRFRRTCTSCARPSSCRQISSAVRGRRRMQRRAVVGALNELEDAGAGQSTRQVVPGPAPNWLDSDLRLGEHVRHEAKARQDLGGPSRVRGAGAAPDPG